MRRVCDNLLDFTNLSDLQGMGPLHRIDGSVGRRFLRDPLLAGTLLMNVGGGPRHDHRAVRASEKRPDKSGLPAAIDAVLIRFARMVDAQLRRRINSPATRPAATILISRTKRPPPYAVGLEFELGLAGDTGSTAASQPVQH